MPANWTNPRTWIDGETPGGATFNVHLRDQLLYLKESPNFDGSVIVTGAITTPNLLSAGALSVAGNITLGASPVSVVTVNGTVVGLTLKTYTETRTNPVIAGGVLTLDCSLGTYFRAMLTEPATVALTNAPPAGRAFGITLILVAGGGALTWPGSVLWPSGAAPVLTTAGGKRDVITLVTEDGGGSWFGIVVGQNY